MQRGLIDKLITVMMNAPESLPAERLLDPVLLTDDRGLDRAIRPRQLVDYIGQPAVCEQMDIFISAARARGEALDHVLIFCRRAGQNHALAHHRP